MSREKVEKLLALAYGTSNKAEAAAAFGRAVAYANQAGIDLKTVRPTGSEPQQERNARTMHRDPFRSDILDLMRLRLELNQEQEAHQTTKLAYHAEIEAHSKTCQLLQEAREMLTDTMGRLDENQRNGEKLARLSLEYAKQKEHEIELLGWEMNALKQQIAILTAK